MAEFITHSIHKYKMAFLFSVHQKRSMYTPAHDHARQHQTTQRCSTTDRPRVGRWLRGKPRRLVPVLIASRRSPLYVAAQLKVPNDRPIYSGDPALGRISHVCESIYAQDGVLWFNDCVVVPSSLCRNVLQHLHASHQGVSTMEQRDRAIVYWPDTWKHIEGTRQRCSHLSITYL